MPRPTDIVMGKTTSEQRREAIIQRAIEVHQPYKVFKQDSHLGFETEGWCIIYTSPRDQSRHIAKQDISTRKRANRLRERLERAWAEGYHTAQEINR